MACSSAGGRSGRGGSAQGGAGASQSCEAVWATAGSRWIFGESLGVKDFNSDGWCVYLAWSLLSVFDGNVGEGKAFSQQLRGSKRAKSNGGRSQGAALPKPLGVFLTVLHLKGFPVSPFSEQHVL